MANVTPGRMTAQVDGDFVVFMIGMRINKVWKLHKWLPVALAMGPMLSTLSRQKDAGLLAFHTWIGPSGPLVVQYWRSVEQLESFARDPSFTHRRAWKAFNKSVGTGGDVGIWHETYVVTNGAYEVLYGNMPRFGLAKAGNHTPVTSTMDGSTDRRTANADA
jgi:hypothetical protein